MPNKFEFNIPLTGGGQITHTIRTGEALFVVGPNGAGKSGLLSLLNNLHHASVRRISAHRQMWFSSNSLDMTAVRRNSLEQNIRSHDAGWESRHFLQYGNERTALALFDLIDIDTMLARKIADFVRSGNIQAARSEGKKQPPIASINELMRLSHIPVQIEIHDGQKVMARKNGGEPYSVAQLSDGERAAFLIAAEVLTAKPGTLLLIDEPERHLHRSIISQLLTLLFQKRPDCAFVISTHEIMLPIDNPDSVTLLLRSSVFNGPVPHTWEATLLPADAPIDESTKIEILGGRQKMIFVEGTAQSLDAPLYSILFPQVSIIPKTTCKEVEYAVRGLRGSESSHWVAAWGIVDRDQRGQEEVEALRTAGIFALPHYSVEALYCHPEILRRVAERICEVTGQQSAELADLAIASANRETLRQRNHFIVGSVERMTRREILNSLPSRADVESSAQINLQVDVGALHRAEQARFDALTQAGDLIGILERYPIRESGALSAVAQTLGFKGRVEYESAVRVLLLKDATALQFLRDLFGTLFDEVAPPAMPTIGDDIQLILPGMGEGGSQAAAE